MTIEIYKNVSPQDVKDFHNSDDVDANSDSHHHTLGTKPYQAAPGNHKKHDGDTDWIDAVLINGWVSFDPGIPIQYQRLGGVMYFRGLLAGGGFTTDAFELPEGFRGYWLRGNAHFPVVNTAALDFVRVSNLGMVQPNNTGTYVDIGAIIFPVGID